MRCRKIVQNCRYRVFSKGGHRGKNLEGLIFHSDQGWQYQHQSYQQRLKNNDLKQSMSRKRKMA